MIYALAHDQTVADDYFAAMQRIEQRLEITPPESPEEEHEAVNVPERTQMLGWIEQLAQPELSAEARMRIAAQLLRLMTPHIAA